MDSSWTSAAVLMLLSFWHCQGYLVFAPVALSQGGGCKSIEQGRVVHSCAFQAALGSRVRSASEFQFRSLESCQM